MATSASRCEMYICFFFYHIIIIPELLPERNTPDSHINADFGLIALHLFSKSLCVKPQKKKKNLFKHYISKTLLSDTLCLTEGLTHRSVPEWRRSRTTYLNDRQMAKKFTATPLRLVSPWKLFFSPCPVRPSAPAAKQFPPAKQVIRTTRKSRLPGLNIGIMHRGGNQEFSSQDPPRLIRGVWHGCQNTDRLFYRCTHADTHTHTETHSSMHAHAQKHTNTRTCTKKNHIDRLFYQLHWLDWHLFSWVPSQLPALRGKYNPNSLALQLLLFNEEQIFFFRCHYG